MTFISYAQNAEDVLLWRALGHVAQGFYIDVGANDPVEHSVTKAFYDAGWHGINIEPMPSHHQVFLRERPRDVNLAVACGAADGAITLYDTPPVNGWATTDAAVAARHRADGVDIVEHQVPLRTLAGICAAHAPAAIHFLKIDVEGFEAEVLRGMDLQRWRPWVLVIEATVPNSRTTNHQQWEALVTAHDYRYAWFDGLNRYYVAAEHAELLAAFTVQPNVFDQYVNHHLDHASNRVKVLEVELAGLHAGQAAYRHQLEAGLGRENAARDQWARQLEAELLAIRASRTWRLRTRLRQLAPGPVRPQVRRLLMRLAVQATVRRLAFGVLHRVPALEARFLRWYASVRGNPDAVLPAPVQVPAAVAHLPQSVRRVLADLERPRPLSEP